MTYERIAIRAAVSAYDKQPIDGVRYVWAGAIDNIQFDVMRYAPLRATVIAFAGSNELWDWWRHLFVRRARLRGLRGVVHRGWLADWRKVAGTVVGAWQQEHGRDDTLVICGHSYGGALAQLAAIHFAMRLPSDQLRLYTYGSPRVGDRGFANTLNGLISRHYRYTIRFDPVVHLPLGLRYKHAGMHIRLPCASKPHAVQSYQERVTWS